MNAVVIKFPAEKVKIERPSYRGLYGEGPLNTLRTARMFLYFKSKYPNLSDIEVAGLAADAVSSEFFSADYQ
jgi:hypothetical protein